MEAKTKGTNVTYFAYHGTSFECAMHIIFEGFKRSKDGMLGEGVYVSTDRLKAINFCKGRKVVLELLFNFYPNEIFEVTKKNEKDSKTW